MTLIVTGGAGFIGNNFIFHKTLQWYLDHEDWWQPIMSGEYQKYYEKMDGNEWRKSQAADRLIN